MPVLVPWEPVWAGTGGSSQPQPVCSQLMDPHISNGWQLPAGNGGRHPPPTPPSKNKKLGMAEHPHSSAPGWFVVELPQGDAEVWGAVCWVGWRQELGVSQKEFTGVLT